MFRRGPTVDIRAATTPSNNATMRNAEASTSIMEPTEDVRGPANSIRSPFSDGQCVTVDSRNAQMEVRRAAA